LACEFQKLLVGLALRIYARMYNHLHQPSSWADWHQCICRKHDVVPKKSDRNNLRSRFPGDGESAPFEASEFP
jgi:hypothetical protein